jgi:hypothetical protein
MELSPLVGAFNPKIFSHELDFLAGFVFLVKLIVDITVADGSFSYLFVAHQNNLPGVVGHLIVKLIRPIGRCSIITSVHVFNSIND